MVVVVGNVSTLDWICYYVNGSVCCWALSSWRASIKSNSQMRSLVLFKNGVEVQTFSHQGPMHKYVDAERQKDHYARFWALEDGKLEYHYRTQNEIEQERELKDRIVALEEEQAGASL